MTRSRLAYEVTRVRLAARRRLRRRGLQQLPGVRAASFAFGIAAQHPRNFCDTIRGREDADVRGCDTFARALRDDDVMVRSRSDLREMRDGEYLMLLSDPTHRISHLQSNASADSSVDFVEDKRGDVIHRGQPGLEREHHASELTA